MIDLIIAIVFGAIKLVGWVFKGIFFVFAFLFTVKILRIIVISVLAVFVPLIVMGAVSPDLGEAAANTALSAVNSTTLYKYSKDVYLDSIIHGSVRVADYTVADETPYFSSVVSRDKLENAEPLGVLPAKTDIELRRLYSENKEEEEDAWVEVFFTNEDKPQYAYILLPAKELEQIVPKKEKKEKKQKQNSNAEYAIVNVSILNVRAGPSTNYDIIEGLNENTKVEVLEKLSSGWVKIKYSGNKTGYVSGNFLIY